ncbi:hypothetical protein O2N63_10445 [Aliiroseovarius sp. KMU-50]|uniref:Uncharacterized protein n=1 Tax=Aliiroseovarius salicola TaxID=3009082 RepID=A0ABT4W252_9RHOB|nr:hypothetical protein [Aliiroseovarius sp. KMU-50]MDA5094504.1 hypothetical protein [Aliiroseovarius sp. KMU-50]
MIGQSLVCAQWLVELILHVKEYNRLELIMQSDLSQRIHLHTRPSIQEWLQIFIRFFDPTTGHSKIQNATVDPPEDALVRLVETSPHLLSDVGFVIDPHRSNNQRTIWISDQAEIEILHPE